MLKANRAAAVVGGGIGGLAAAIGLRRAGWDVTVFERSSGLPGTGTGLGMWPSALRALDTLGLGAQARDVGRLQGNGVFRRPDGTAFATLDVDRIQQRYGEPVYLLSRPALLGLLAAALPEGVVRFDSPIDEVEELRGRYDVLIGADGIRSVVRTELFADASQLRFAGATVWRGVADVDCSEGGETWGAGVKFGLTPQEPGRTNWYAVLTAPEGYRPPGDDVTELRRLFGDWHDPIPAILDRYDASDVLRHDLHYLDPPLRSYVRGNVALVGDAAHAMTPDLGQGACQALIDGVTLAECLAAAATTTEGLREYDRRRRRPTQRIARMALWASKLSQIRRCTPARDRVLRLALAVGTPA
ncbi:FAD-dependent oxidoreductase [Kribbella swartbergensis]